MTKLKLNRLRKAITAENKKLQNDRLSQLNECKSIEQALNNWQLNQYLTPTTKRKKWNSLTELKQYLKGRILKAYAKSIESKITQFDAVLNSGDLIECTITIEWKKNRTWGSNPRAKAEYKYIGADGLEYRGWVDGSSISGCGYDKQSTAVAEVLNGVNPLLKALYKKRNQDVTTKNRELFGYGSGYGLLPRIEGGVGVSCYPDIFKTVGFKFETVAGGSNFDVYKITRAKAKRSK